MRCRSFFLLLQSFLQALCRGFVPPLSTKLDGTAGSGGSGTAAGFKVLQLGRRQSTRHCVLLPPVITWSCIKCWLTQWGSAVTAFVVRCNYSFQSISVSFSRSSAAFGCLRASICTVVCARPSMHPHSMGVTYVTMSSIFCFFSKFLSQNYIFENWYV